MAVEDKSLLLEIWRTVGSLMVCRECLSRPWRNPAQGQVQMECAPCAIVSKCFRYDSHN